MELLSIALWLLFAAVAAAAPSSSLPTVDLGYQIHRAISLNQSSQVYNFSNIRYAQPPVGQLRFKAPVAPTGRSTAVQDGSKLGRICPQSTPGWGYISENFTLAWLQGEGNTFNFTAAEEALLAAAAANPAALKGTPDPRTSEDCLFLDVFVPKAVFNKKVGNSGKGGAAVLVWIYGGGYVAGSKGGSGSPEFLIETSKASGGDGIIFVELNYRLGALGFMAGPSLIESGGVANAAFYDQRLAIEWVSKNIHLFGGDPNRITIMGESAGGGSVMHQITAYGGQQPVLFQQAITQSAAWTMTDSPFANENATQMFLQTLGVSSIEEARQASSADVIAAQYQQILYAPYGRYYFGPAVDGIFVPALPGQLLSQGAFAKNLKIMVGHNAEEGVGFTDPRIKNNQDLAAFFKASYPGADPSVIQKLLSLYPEVYDGTYPWRTQIDRVIQLISEGFFTCNTNYLDRAFGNKSYAYEFEVPPSLHGQDVAYTFYNGQGNVKTGLGLVAQIAEALQGYITNFVQNGDPNGKGLPKFTQYGVNAMEEGLNITGVTMQKDPTGSGAENARCLWWQKGLYY